MATTDEAVAATLAVISAQTNADDTGVLPVGAETLLVLELGDSDDSNAFIRNMSLHDVYNVTPPRRESFTRLPTPISERMKLFKTAPPSWWLDRFVKQDPIWIYISGHYTGELYNRSRERGETGAVNMDFNAPDGFNNVLWSYYLVRDVMEYRLADRCQVVIIMGCNAIPFVDATQNIQLMLTRDGGVAPLVLGFNGTCPTKSNTDLLMTFFVRALATNWTLRTDDDHIIASWLDAGKNWSLELGRRLGFIDRFGVPFRVMEDPAGPWEWEMVP